MPITKSEPPPEPKPPPEPEPPHGALGEIREDIFLPLTKSRPSVPVPKAKRPSKRTEEKVGRSKRR
jgi:hypothetical protein